MSKKYTIKGGFISRKAAFKRTKTRKSYKKLKFSFVLAAILNGWLSSVREIGYAQQSFSQWIPQSFAENFPFFQKFTKKS